MNVYNNFNEQEKMIADCFLSGFLSNKSISNNLRLSIYQVKYFFDKLLKKHKISSREQLFQILFLEKQQYITSQIQKILLNIC